MTTTKIKPSPALDRWRELRRERPENGTRG